LIALTETDKADVKRLYGENLPVVVEANSIDVSGLKVPVGLKYRENEYAYVCIARFDFQKGQDILVKAIDFAQKELRASGKRTLLIGGGATLEATKRFVDEKGIADLVEFAGEISDAGVYMACGKVLIAPSRWEGMPYLLLEAVARGRHIIASDCPGNRDVVKNYAQATLFPVEDSIALAGLLS
jgi:glycosyltransferase involved in cell wall biosynthesis